MEKKSKPKTAALATVVGYRGSWKVYVGPVWVRQENRKSAAEAIARFLNKDDSEAARFALMIGRAPALSLPEGGLEVYSAFLGLGRQAQKILER